MDGFIESFLPLLRKYAVESLFLTLALILTAASFVIFYAPAADRHEIKVSELAPREQPPDNASFMIVEVSGAVYKPGVFELPLGSRLKDAVLIAGGLSGEADIDFFSRNFNQARYLADQEKIHIPSSRDVSIGIYNEREQIIDYRNAQPIPASQTMQSPDEKIRINSAPVEDIEALPGVGKATANKIINNRPYGKVQDLIIKKAISEKVFGQIKDYIDL